MCASIAYGGLKPVVEFYSPDKELNDYEKVLDYASCKMELDCEGWHLLKEMKLGQNNGFKCLILVDRKFVMEIARNGAIKFKYSRMFSLKQSRLSIPQSYAKDEGKNNL